jgi:hypothetical protein
LRLRTYFASITNIQVLKYVSVNRDSVSAPMYEWLFLLKARVMKEQKPEAG